MIDVIVDEGGEYIVRKSDRPEVAGKMQIDIFHRHDLGVPATRRAALHAEHRPECGLAQADHCLLADVIERIPEAHRHRGLALPRRRRGNRGDEDEPPVRAAFQACEIFERHLRLVTAKGLERVLRNAKPVERKLADPPHRCPLGDFNVVHCETPWIPARGSARESRNITSGAGRGGTAGRHGSPRL